MKNPIPYWNRRHELLKGARISRGSLSGGAADIASRFERRLRRWRVRIVRAAVGLTAVAVGLGLAGPGQAQSPAEVTVELAVVTSNGDVIAEAPESIGSVTVRFTATTNGAEAPSSAFGFAAFSRSGSARTSDDFVGFYEAVTMAPDDFALGTGGYVATRDITLVILDDAEDEVGETLTVEAAPIPGGVPDWVSLPAPLGFGIEDDDSVPGAPTDPEASADGQTAIELSWVAPVDPGSSPITGYRIEWSPDGASGWAILVENTNSTGTTYADGGLSAETTRYYRVSAISAAGVGEASDAKGATTVPSPVVRIAAGPTPVTEGTAATFVLSRTGATTEELSVSLTVTETGSMIDGAAPESVVFAADAAVTTLTVNTVADDLDEADSTITAKVTALQDVYKGSATSSADVFVEDDDSVPGAPGNPEASTAGQTAIELSWVAPVDPGSSPITGYRIEWSPDGASGWAILVENANSTGTTYADGGLSAETTRYYRVSAISAAGIGEASDATGATTAPFPVVTIAAGPTPVTEGTGATFVLSRTGATTEELSVSLTVTETGSMIDGAAPESVVFAADAAETTLTVNTESDDWDEADSTITATVTAMQDVYEVGATSSADVFVEDDDSVPGAPGNPEASAAGQTAIELSWVAPVDPGSSPITGYLIEWSSDGASGWAILVENTNSTGTTYTDGGLSVETTRYYRVSAISAAGVGEASDATGATTAPLPVVTIAAGPAPVTEGIAATFVLSRTGATTEELTVSLSVTETGSKIDGAAPESVVFAVDAAETTLTVNTVSDDLDEADSTITATVTAVQDVYEAGDTSSAVVSVEDDDSVPGAPTNPEASADGQTAIELSWVAPVDPGSSPITGYRIEWSPDGISHLAVLSDWVILAENTNSTATTYADGGLSAETTRYYRVSAISAAGVGGASDAAGATTAPLPVVTIAAGPTPVTEGTGATFVLSRTGATTEELSVSLTVIETGSMIDGAAPESVGFAADAAETTLTVNTESDDWDEADSTITATVTAMQDVYEVGATSSAGVSVEDDDDLAVQVAMAVVNAEGAVVTEVPEDVGTTTIRLTATTNGSGGSPADGFSITVTSASDSAVAVHDYEVPQAEVRFAVADWTFVEADDRYAASRDVPIMIVDDSLAEGLESFGLVMGRTLGTPGYVSLAPRIELVIVDDETVDPRPEVAFSTWTPGVTEGENATFTLVRSGSLTVDLTVSVEVSETGSMIDGQSPSSVVFPAGSENVTLEVLTLDDGVEEPDSVVTASIAPVEGASYRLNGRTSAESTVRDNDQPPAEAPGAPTELAGSPNGYSAIDLSWTAPESEGTSPITGYRIESSSDGDSDWQDLVADTGSDAPSYTDGGLAAGTVKYYRVFATSADGTGPASNVARGATRVSEVPGPAIPEVGISSAATVVGEGEEVTLELRRSGVALAALTVSVEVKETGSMIIGTPPASVVFNAGEEVAMLTIRTSDDAVDEPDSDITATLKVESGAGYTVGAASAATVRVKDDDESSPVANVPSAPTRVVAAANGQTAIALSWSAPEDDGGSPITGYGIEWSPDGRSWTRLASTGADATNYSDVGLAAGTTRYYRICAVNSAGSGPFSGVARVMTSLPLPDVTIRAGNGPIVEGARAMFALRRSGSTAMPLTVHLDVAGTRARISGSPPSLAAFGVGAAETTVAVSTVDDSLDQPDGEITVTVLDGDGYALAGSSSATVKVRDNDTAPLVEVVEASAPEGEGELTFAVLLDGPSAAPVGVRWSTAGGTASPDVDYAAAAGLVTFKPGATKATISVLVHDDGLFEESETFTVRLSRPENARLSDGGSSAVGVIENDDAMPVLRVEDASAPESAGELMFTVSLEGGSELPASVRWATSPGTAQAGLDYREASGTLTIEPGTTRASVAVELIEDRLHEEAETLHLSLSGAANAMLEGSGEAVALGTIEDDDEPAPAEAWLSRFGRTAASNAVSAVEDRLTGRLGSGRHLTVAGHRIDVSGAGADGSAVPANAPVAGPVGIGQAAGSAVGRAGFGGHQPGASAGRYESGRRDMSSVLARSSFLFSSDSTVSEDGSPISEGGAAGVGDVGARRWSLWGSGATTRFSGGKDALRVSGDVVTGTIGTDIERGRVLFGVAVSHSRGDGGYEWRGAGGQRPQGGDASSSLTTGLPYLRVAVNDRLSVWGALGRGSGSMTLREGDLASVETDIGLSMGALGARQELRSPAAGGLSLALRTDLLLVRTTSDETRGLPSLSTDVSRLRLMVEGARQRRLESGSVLTPSAELGLRYDNGDAEAGVGVEVGAGLRFENVARGLAAEVNLRSLLAHDAGSFSEWGVGGSLRFDPGQGQRGLSLGLRSSWGAGSSGVARLWEEAQSIEAPGSGVSAQSGLAEADLGYAVPVLGGRGRVTPYLGARLSERSGMAYLVGARLRVGEFIDIEIEGSRVERAGLPQSDRRGAVMATLRW